ncbi:TPA: hypothetical protein ACMFP1_002917 [Pseudomonas aeruginosa]|nr:hypothetical protein UFRH6_2 [Pseudomonas phage UF_RH6]
MAFSQGQAANFNDLLDKLVAFLTTDPDLVAAGQAYEVLYDQTLPYNGQEVSGLNRRHVAFRSKGLSGLDQIYTAISTAANTATDYYNWRIMGGTGLNLSALTPGFRDLTQGLINPCPFTQGGCFWNQAMPYWFVANGRRWWVTAKVSSVFTTVGAGFILPPCPPDEFPYPLAVWGSHTAYEGVRWSDSSSNHSSPTMGRAALRTPSGQWWDFYGGMGGPYAGLRCVMPTGRYAPDQAARNRLLLVRDALDGSFPLLPVALLVRDSQGSIPFGEADGLFWVPVLNNGSEDTIVANGATHVVFQSAFRTDSPNLLALRAN